MANPTPRKIDEQISYNWLFFLLAGAFGAVTFWAVYDETVTRREYKGYQEAFFGIESSLAEKSWTDAKAKLEAGEPWKKATAELKTLEDDLRARKSEYETAKAQLQELEFTAFDKQQNKTFTKSILDEKYYYYTVAKHELVPGTGPGSPAAHEYAERKKAYDEYVDKLAADEKVENEATARRDCRKKGHVPGSGDLCDQACAASGNKIEAQGVNLCDVMGEAEYAKAGFKTNGRPLAVDAYTARIDKLKKDIEDLERPTEDLHRKYLAAKDKESSGPLGLFGPATEVIQENLEDIGRVDRCESCHLGAARGGFEKVTPAYFRSHPYRRTLLALHPPEKFGCTTCHDGQGRATTRFYAHAPTEEDKTTYTEARPGHYEEKHFWETPLLHGPFMESECRQCHRQEVDLRANLKCESDDECPTMKDADGKSVQLKCAELIAPINPSTNLQASLDAKIEPGKYCGFPDPGDDSKVQPTLVDLAPHLARGRKVIEEVGCFGCHPIEGYEGKPKVGPDLRHAASKLNPAWMVEWILNPKAFRPNTRMPNFFPERLAIEEEKKTGKRLYPETAKPKYIDGWAAIAQVTEKDPEKRKEALEALGPEHFQPEQQATLLASFLLANSTPFDALPAAGSVPPGDAARGKKLVETLGCYGCHVNSDPKAEHLDHKNRASHYDHGPDLGNIGAKSTREWIYAWIKDPKAYAPATRMPNLRLSDDEARDIATYLAGNKYVAGAAKEYTASAPSNGVQPTNLDYQVLGKKLVANYGCYGCHYIKGYEATPGIGAELTEFGTKEVSRLDFGDFIVKHSLQTWDNWLRNKLEHPRVYRYERVDTRMPQFDLDGEEIEDVMVVLKGMRGRTRDNDERGHRLTEAEQIRENGRALVRMYNCYGCHTVDGHTGDIRQMKQYGGDEGPRFAPPVINGEGAKTQPEWLFSFLKQPIKLRPHLTVRMPTFGFSDEQATSLVGMFSALDGADFPYHDYRGTVLDGARRQQAETAFKAAQCTQCHTLGDTPSPEMAAKGAPNLLLAKHRLRAEWIARWIQNPQVLYPGVNMPSFFASGNPLAGADKNPQFASMPGIHELSGMDAAGVIYLLRDLLMTIEPAGSASSGGKVKSKTASVPAGVKHASR